MKPLKWLPVAGIHPRQDMVMVKLLLWLVVGGGVVGGKVGMVRVLTMVSMRRGLKAVLVLVLWEVVGVLMVVARKGLVRQKA